ncbi:GerAB/ArcD/ProY family transporter [Anoxybacillus rupiensis]|uniref:GerAB/ArcD/ProY family transporter n=1 Tax=Anoxybacteroides rupiense TaxID=311460 RepID=A0ABT5W4V4_9BACL|nr:MULTISPECIES: GerAB/ArcD/ProY family transporter [Anoxybacillus]MDE8564348.1 GerAB/ArcD/ProY family transporter [Anoxybacillus rupiensis]QHC03484.1 GerAB/ArcD/ProY family transporter [Anoxybacillus sp. PDR2]
MQQTEHERFHISPFFVFFTIHCSQIGVGILSLPNLLNEETGHDGWMSVIIAGTIIHILIWMIYKIFKSAGENKDVIQVNVQYFGKWIGNMVNVVLLVYFFSFALIVMRIYTEIIQVWVFPLMGAWQFCLIILVLTYYTVSGGFRVVVGLCFWGVMIPLLIIVPMLVFPLEYAHYRNFLPIFDHSVLEVIKGAKASTLDYLGFEMILMYYSFVKNAPQSHKWAQWGNAFTTFLYLIVVCIAIVFYNEEQIRHIIWPTLTLAKIPEIPFIERMEYIVISTYVMVIFPIICLAVWSVTRGLKQIISLKQRISLPIILLLLFISSFFFTKRAQIDQFSNLVSTVGFYVLMAYIPFLWIYVSIAKLFKSKASEK